MATAKKSAKKSESPVGKKTICPVSREQFVKKATPLPVKIGKTGSVADARQFSSGSLGWYFGEKVTVVVDGVSCEAQVTCSVVLVGSRDLPGGPENDDEE